MSKVTNAQYDPEKGTITDDNGVVWDVRFKLPDKVEEGLGAKLSDLHAYCAEHGIPYYAAFVTANGEREMGSWCRGIHLGARTPIRFAVAREVFQRILNGGVDSEALALMISALTAGNPD